MNGLFISWTSGNGRTIDLAAELGYETEFIQKSSKFGVPGRYIKQLRTTRRVLHAERPRSVCLMLPPFPLIYAAFPRRRKDSSLLVDLHTGFFSDPRWSWATRSSLRAIARRRGIAIVTNRHLQDECSRYGIQAVIVHDIIHNLGAAAGVGEFLLCPVSYSNDEPIAEILQAAAQTPNFEWRLTGNAPTRVRDNAPKNVTFTGFVTRPRLESLYSEAAGVVALTTRPHTMQRAGYEALSYGNAQITSDFPELREFYGDAALYTRANPTDIASAATQLFRQRGELQEKSIRLREERIVEQLKATAELKRLLR